MSKNKEFAEEKLVFETGKVYLNVKNVAIVNCMGEYTMITLTNGQDHKYKTAILNILE